MAELNLKQITEKLNTEFVGNSRKLIFWYDDNAEFIDDIETLGLENAKVLHLSPDNQFYIKYYLERVDTTTNYLVYAPFPKPSVRENHLSDTIRYSKEFFADRASLLTIDLGIDERYKSVIQDHIKFFGDKKRTQAFYDLDIESYNKITIETAIMSVLCKSKVAVFEEILRIVLLNSELENNVYLAEFEKYGLIKPFWKQVETLFGYTDAEPTLEKLAMSLFVTYTSEEIKTDVPVAWNPFITFKSGTVVAFMDNLMNNVIYGEKFDQLSSKIYSNLKAECEFNKLPVESLVNCYIFAGIDEIVINWMIERLELEDISAKLGMLSIPEISKIRRQTHFGKLRHAEYHAIENAWNLISNSNYTQINGLMELVKSYTNSMFKMDRWYRCFYYYIEKIEDDSKYSRLKELVENIYTNDYLSKVCVNWNDYFAKEIGSLNIEKQTNFYSKNISNAKEQTVVIISDALRYEVGVSLFEKLTADAKCTASIKPMLSTLPSITAYGMAALLPHKRIEIDSDYSVTIDGNKVDSLKQREDILKTYKLDSRCVHYDDIKGLSIAETKEIFARQDVVYIYHNQIDARGDKLNTENEVFVACEEAIDEIHSIIRKLTSANKTHFIVTADHGFIYKKNKLSESDKIDLGSGKVTLVNRRFILSDEAVVSEGVVSLPIKTTFNNKDERIVSFPMGADVFKATSSGMNYVHGGCSPQEMIIPLIEVKTEKGKRETTNAQIELVSLVTKLTNLITSLDFVQTEEISDVVKETTYRVFFVDQYGEKISNEHLYVADKKDKDTVKRMFKLRFSLKNKKYSKVERYYLVAIDDNNSLEVLRHEVLIDIAFADDFGFDL